MTTGQSLLGLKEEADSSFNLLGLNQLGLPGEKEERGRPVWLSSAVWSAHQGSRRRSAELPQLTLSFVH